jgi:23S rRNA pseudouridine1911/1915/1917 synthase
MPPLTPQEFNPSLIWIWLVDANYDRADTAILSAIAQSSGSLESKADTEVAGEIPALTRSQLQRLMEEGRVTQGTAPLKANSKLRGGMKVRIEFPPPRPTELVPENQPLDILFQDEHLVVVNKPPGLTVHPSSTQMEGTLVHVLLHHIQDLSGIGGVLRPGIVHRIDKNTSGALVITKNDLAHTRLAEIFAQHDIERAYWALCYGSPDSANSSAPIKIESLIGRSPNDRKKMSMKVTTGRKATSYYRKLTEFSLPNKKPFASWVEVTLETGRTHQVRVHLTGIGHSILGDPMYGTPTDTQHKWQALPLEVRNAVKILPGQALHARVLGFKHPITGEKLRFEAPAPPQFQNVLDALKNYS